MLYDRRKRREHCIHGNLEDNLQEALTGYSQRLSPKFKVVFISILSHSRKGIERRPLSLIHSGT